MHLAVPKGAFSFASARAPTISMADCMQYGLAVAVKTSLYTWAPAQSLCMCAGQQLHNLRACVQARSFLLLCPSHRSSPESVPRRESFTHDCSCLKQGPNSGCNQA